MSLAPRTRDCIVLFKGDAYFCEVADSLAASGWTGGQGVKWSQNTKDGFFVEQSDGFYAGFLLWGSDEPSDRYTAMTENQVVYKFGTLCAGGWLIMTTAFERYTWLSRQGPGPLVEIVYTESDRLVFSNRGLWTNEDEWTLALDPRRPNVYYIGFVAQAPTAENGYYMTIQTSI